MRTSDVSANNSRLLVFSLGKDVKLPVASATNSTSTAFSPPLLTGTNEQVIEGEASYARLCSGCHGPAAVAEKSIPDLRYSATLHSLKAWNAVVVDGARATQGMASFSSLLAPGETETIRHYIISRANKPGTAAHGR